jgi:hypothetical protein
MVRKLLLRIWKALDFRSPRQTVLEDHLKDLRVRLQRASEQVHNTRSDMRNGPLHMQSAIRNYRVAVATFRALKDEELWLTAVVLDRLGN